MIKKERLLKTVTPHSDESLMGYILRLTEINDYDTPSWILQLAELGPFLISDASFAFKSSLNLLPFSKLTGGVEVEKLAALKYEPTDPSREKYSSCLVFGIPIPKCIIRLSRPKICPGCLRDFGYPRRIWELTPVTACPIHKCLLLQECPNCARPFSWLRNKVSRCRCGCEWRDCSSALVDDSALKVTRHIHDCCHLPTGEEKDRSRLADASPLNEVDLQYFLSALFLVDSQLSGFLDTTGTYLIHLRNIEVQENLSKALLIFDNWPENFYAFLDTLRARVKSEGYGGVKKEFNKINYALYRTLQSRQLDFIRSAFEEYLLTRWDGGQISNLSRFKKSTKLKSKYLSRSEAKALLRVENGAIDLHLACGRLQGVVRTNGSSRRYLIERSSVLKLKCELEQALNLKHIAPFLGSYPTRILELVGAGVLKPICGPTVDGFGDWLFSVSEAKELLEQLRKRTAKSPNVKMHEVIDFSKVTQMLGFVGGSFPRFIKDIIGGTICPCGENLKKVGFRRLLFSEPEVSSYLLALSRESNKDTYTVSELTTILGLTEQAIYHLIAKGILPAHTKTDGPHPKRVVTRKDLNSFISTYVVLLKLTPELGTESGFLAKLLINRGIQPVSGGKKEGHRYVFKRNELESLDLARLISEAREKNALRRKEPQVITLIQAAERLGVDTEIVQQLVENGVIQAYGKRQRKEVRYDEPHFSTHTIKKYEGWAKDYIGLVTAKVAAKMLGMSISNFMTVYSRRNRIIALNPKGKTKPHYFKKQDVEALVKQKEQTITAPEAAEAFGVNISCIHKMKKSGHLKPVSGPDVDGFGLTLYLRSDIEKIRVEREAFKLQRMKEGKTGRFGRARQSYPCPIQKKLAPRIERMFKEWQARPTSKEDITGADIHRRLNKEGYCVSATTVYTYLRRRTHLIPHYGCAQGTT